MRPQAAFVACEWDRENILKQVPSSTWQGEKWDNSRWVGQWQEEAADIFRRNTDHIELTLHGVGHEYWSQCELDGSWKFSRAEWHDTNGTMRPRDEVFRHLEFFQRILEQHQLGAFPTSFVPCAFKHRFDQSSFGLSSILKSFGVAFLSTPFREMHNAEHVQHQSFGFENDVFTVDRGHDLIKWNELSAGPQELLTGPVCGMHWPNILHDDPERNEEIVALWVAYLKQYNSALGWTIASDTRTFVTQLQYKEGTKVQITRNGLLLDFSNLRDTQLITAAYSFTLKIASMTQMQMKFYGVDVFASSVAEINNSYIYTLILRPHKKMAEALIDTAHI
jgi:hypothetical protein